MLTIIIVCLTAIVSYFAFQNYNLFQRLKFSSPRVVQGRQYYRLISHGFIHGDWTHLIVNLLVLYSFGRNLESYYLPQAFGERSSMIFLLIYFGGMIISSASGLTPRRVSENYGAVGASGGVAAVLFANILFDPMRKILFYGVIPAPGILFGVGYLGYSYYMIKKGQDNVAHDAHFIGAICGFLIPLLFRPQLFISFIENLL